MKLDFQLLCFLKIVLFMSACHVSCAKEEWPKSLFRILYVRNAMVKHTVIMKSLEEKGKKPNPDDHKRFLRDIRQLQLVDAIEDFALASFDVPVVKRFITGITETLKFEKGDLKASFAFSGKQLESFQERSRGLFDALKKRMEDKSRELTTEGLCSNLQEPYPKLDITINDICSSFHQCATESYPYGSSSEYFEEGYHDARNSCTSDNKCDIRKALPMMAGVLYNSINSFIVQRFCPKELSNDDLKNIMMKLQQDCRLFMAYAYIMPPLFDSFSTEFIQKAFESQGLSDLNIALQLVKETEVEFSFMPVACEEIKFSEACVYEDIYTQYTLIEKLRKHRSDPGLIKDLRLNSKVEKQTMIKLQRESLQHLETLTSIEKLDENLKASVNGISTYFASVAQYDEGIAEQDITFIDRQLKNFECNLKTVQENLDKDMTLLANLQLSVAIANFIEETAKLAARIAENCNPLRVIFGGSEPGDIAEQMGKVGNAEANTAKATALKIAAESLNSDSDQFNRAFFNGDESNKNQIKALRSLVDKIRKGQSEDIGADGADFIREYGAYTPQTDRSSIAGNNAKWSAFKGAMCDLLNEEVGIAGAVQKTVASMLLICESLDGTLAQFFTLREDIFDFQFQMVDALARIVRANMAKRFSANIEGKGDVLDGRQLLVGSLMIQNRMQTHASLFCDILEYKNLGKPVAACSSGLFSKDNLESLIAYKDTSPPSLVERDVYIPTKPRFQGDTGYIDLSSLAENGHVVFKIPVDSSWLQHYRWILDGENIPFVEDFKIYLPHKEYENGEEQQHTTTRVTITSIGGNAVSTIAPNTSPVYVLPVDHSTYVTVYEEGYPSCKLKYRIPNPYGLCNNLPDICDKSSREAGESLLPTILSSWKLSFTIQRGEMKLEWEAPSPSTNLMIRATLKIRMWPAGQGDSDIPPHVQRSKDKQKTRKLCCNKGNKYRDLLGKRSRCKRCPDHSTSKLRGLYCEIDQGQSENTGGE